MKRSRLLPIIIVTLVLSAVLVAGASAFSQVQNRGDEQPAQQQTAPVAEQPVAPTAEPERPVVAKGIVVPLERATLSMAAGGIVSEIVVPEGQAVKAGQTILRLQNERQQAALAEADAALASARAQLALTKAGARPEALAEAQAGLDAANARLQRMTEAGRPGDVAAAQSTLNAARAALVRLQQGPDKNQLIAAKADLANAEAAVRNAQAAYDKVKDQPNVGMMPQSLQLEQATNALNAAEARLDELVAPPTADRVAQAQASIKQAQAELDRVNQPVTKAQLLEAQAGVRQAEAQLSLVHAGARQEEIAVAEAAVAQAEAARMQALAALHDTELTAPFSGTVATLHVRTGEQVTPGTPVAELGDVSTWQVETDDLSELDVVQVQAGQEVQVTFDAIPELKLKGAVERIEPKGEKKLGDMTYTVVVRLAESDPRLLWNMTAVVNAQ